MGTRSTTKVYREYIDDKGKPYRSYLLGLYKQMDGYTESWGQELKDFISKCLIVNGINSDKEQKGKILCNGAGCFALQLVNEFKDGAGDLYATSEDDAQQYNYQIIIRSKNNKPFEVEIICLEEASFSQLYKIQDDGSIE